MQQCPWLGVSLGLELVFPATCAEHHGSVHVDQRRPYYTNGALGQPNVQHKTGPVLCAVGARVFLLLLNCNNKNIILNRFIFFALFYSSFLLLETLIKNVLILVTASFRFVKSFKFFSPSRIKMLGLLGLFNHSSCCLCNFSK